MPLNYIMSVCLGALLTVGVQSSDPWVVSSFSVFGFTLVLLYTMSTLYHSFHPPHLKKIFKLLDHVAIYLLIAGTYTPFMLVSLRDGNGFLILGIIWVLALAGILVLVYLFTARAVIFRLDPAVAEIDVSGIAFNIGDNFLLLPGEHRVTGTAEGYYPLDQAITALEETDERLARVVTLRYFAGLSVKQTAEVLGTSPAPSSVTGPTRAPGSTSA